ncbi:MAG TPA: hypothetical protein ENO20_05170 [Bacteroides sp.]|nr:hypothetical protein [Bacteroides sp.]
MKTNSLLKFLFPAFLVLTVVLQEMPGQTSRMDSLIFEKKLNIIEGSIPLYCSPYYEERGTMAQSLLDHIIGTYSGNGSGIFQLKLAVLDSSRWSGFSFPYGFFFIHQGWIVIPADLDFQKFSHLWGYSGFTQTLTEKLRGVSANPEEFLTDVHYIFTIAHELGHYYTEKVLNASPPDSWTAEWMASYFATDYLHRNDAKTLEGLNIWEQTYTEEITPKYRSLQDFNTRYASVGLQNYVWFHCMFQPMINDIYSEYGTGFMELFAETFPRTGTRNELSQEELLDILDRITGDRASYWVEIMESDPEL